MKRSIYLIIIICISSLSFAQDSLKLTSDGVVPVFVKIEGKTAGELYNKALDWLQTAYKTPETKTENERIKINGFAKDAWYYKNMGTNYYFDMEYSIEVTFKDSEYKLEFLIGQLYYKQQEVNDRIKDFFKKDGSITQMYSDAVPSIEKTMNDLATSFYDYVSGETTVIPTSLFNSLYYSQNVLVNNVKKPVHQNDVIFFYGYDISHAKITDPKRIGQNLSDYLLELVGHNTEQIKDKTLKKWIGIENINYDFSPTHEVNIIPSTESFYCSEHVLNRTLNIDSIQQMIKNYNIKEREGTGFVVIYEYFSKKRKSVTGYGCLFDIKTREIQLLMHKELKDGNSYNRFSDFWTPSIELVKSFCLTINPTNKKRK